MTGNPSEAVVTDSCSLSLSLSLWLRDAKCGWRSAFRDNSISIQRLVACATMQISSFGVYRKEVRARMKKKRLNLLFTLHQKLEQFELHSVRCSKCEARLGQLAQRLVVARCPPNTIRFRCSQCKVKSLERKRCSAWPGSVCLCAASRQWMVSPGARIQNYLVQRTSV